jgi:hypothetical protein
MIVPNIIRIHEFLEFQSGSLKASAEMESHLSSGFRNFSVYFVILSLNRRLAQRNGPQMKSKHYADSETQHGREDIS